MKTSTSLASFKPVPHSFPIMVFFLFYGMIWKIFLRLYLLPKSSNPMKAFNFCENVMSFLIDIESKINEQFLYMFTSHSFFFFKKLNVIWLKPGLPSMGSSHLFE